MKAILTSLFLSLAFLVHGQMSDTLIIRAQIDSLISFSDSLRENQNLDDALEILQQAEKKHIDAIGTETPLYASILNNIGLIYYYNSDFSKTETYWLKAKNLREKLLGKEHPQYASSVNNLGALYKTMGENEKTESLFIEAKNIREKIFGKEHPKYATSLSNLGALYLDMEQYDQAEVLYIEAKAIRGKVLGKENRQYADILYNLGLLYNEMGKLQLAESFYIEAIEIQEKVVGKEHLDYAQSLNNLGNLHLKMGKLQLAETSFLVAKAIREKIVGKEHLGYSESLNNMGALYLRMGKFEKSEQFFFESKEIVEKVLGKENLDYAKNVNNLGVLYLKMGKYKKAEAHFLEDKEIKEKVLGKENLQYANNLSNIGVLYAALGQYEKAKIFYMETKAIREKILGKEHLDYASCLNNLGTLFLDMEDYKNAEKFCLDAKEIRERLVGKENLHYARILLNLGAVYWETEQYDKAETHYIESKEVLEKVLGKEHPDYASIVYNLGKLYMNIGQDDKAEKYYTAAKAIREKTLGKEHPEYALSINSLGLFYWRTGQNNIAEKYLSENNEIRSVLLLNGARHLSENDMLSYTTTFLKDQNLFLSFAQNQNEVSGISYDNSLFYKGFLLTTSQQVKRLAQTNSISNELFLDLKANNRRLAKEYSIPIVERDSSTISILEEECNKLEKELVSTVAEFGETFRQVNWQEVQAALNPGESAIEFVHYKVYNPDPTDSIMYAALLLKPGDKQPKFIPLFKEESLRLLLDLHQERRSDYVNDLYKIKDRGAIVINEVNKSLYELIWKPIEKDLNSITKISFSPTGLLHRINIAAIPYDDEQSLCDKYNFIQLASTRQLVVPFQSKSSTSDALLMGGIEYDLDSLANNSNNQDLYLDEAIASRSEPTNKLDGTLGGGPWTYLKYTEKEVHSIDNILSESGLIVETHKAYNATEEVFSKIGKEGNSPSIIHLATHGFFFPDPKESSSNKNNALRLKEPIFKMSDHPMIRSGLILSGGNQSWQAKPDLNGKEDGILTAYEVSQMDLSHTELVVLSACETGLGQINGNEGVYGLQRAFKIAGVKYLIMSLWQVPDRETKDFMVGFYEHYLIDKMTIPEAFRKTQNEMKERFYNPYQWAGFILVE